MSLLRHLQHWLYGPGRPLVVADFVPETHPLRQWAETFPWAALLAAGAAQLGQWSVTARALGLTAINQFCDRLDRWQEKIANYFLSRASIGPTEGFNNGLRTLLRRT